MKLEDRNDCSHVFLRDLMRRLIARASEEELGGQLWPDAAKPSDRMSRRCTQPTYSCTCRSPATGRSKIPDQRQRPAGPLPSAGESGHWADRQSAMCAPRYVLRSEILRCRPPGRPSRAAAEGIIPTRTIIDSSCPRLSRACTLASARWPHGNGPGFNIQLEALPLGDRIRAHRAEGRRGRGEGRVTFRGCPASARGGPFTFNHLAKADSIRCPTGPHP
jgi:hypothetical protein